MFRTYSWQALWPTLITGVSNCDIYKATLQYVTVIYNGLDIWYPILDTDFHNIPHSTHKFYSSSILWSFIYIYSSIYN